MAGFLQNLFGKKQVPSLSVMPAEFPQYAEKAIKLITGSDGQLENEQAVDLFIKHGIPYKEGVELVLFLPTAFCRHMLPQVTWPDYYCEQTSTDGILEIRYESNPRYHAIENALKAFLTTSFTREDYLKIASRDAAFKVINQLLAAGGKLENVSISPDVIVR